MFKPLNPLCFVRAGRFSPIAQVEGAGGVRRARDCLKCHWVIHSMKSSVRRVPMIQSTSPTTIAAINARYGITPMSRHLLAEDADGRCALGAGLFQRPL